MLAGLTLAMAILPNEFSVVVTAFLALGAWRLSRRRVLTRRIPAVEALGAVTVLCVDKTGTLTQNQMTVSRLAIDGASFDVERLEREPLPEDFHGTVEYAVLASRKDPFDPMEIAFKHLAEDQLAGTEHLHPDWVLVREYPLTRARLAVVQIWRATGGELVIACKGAPESVAQLCAIRGADAPWIDGARGMAVDGRLLRHRDQGHGPIWRSLSRSVVGPVGESREAGFEQQFVGHGRRPRRLRDVVGQLEVARVGFRRLRRRAERDPVSTALPASGAGRRVDRRWLPCRRRVGSGPAGYAGQAYGQRTNGARR
jgi:hypothetical protein